MRERTTWSRDQIKQAAQNKKADPYLMNQDHVGQQPPADKYVTGDPSTFAEDVHPSKDTWEAEYANGQVKRDEIGMPEFRKDTFNHPEKTAADKALLVKKANLCIRVAAMMLGKKATEQAVEDQSVSLMHMPNTELVETFNRLAGDDDQKAEGQGQEQDQQKQALDQQQAGMQQQSAAYQQAQAQCKQAIQAGDDEGVKQAIQAMIQAQMQQPPQAPVGVGTATVTAEPQQQAPVGVGTATVTASMVEKIVQAAVKKALDQQALQQQAQQQAPVALQEQQALQQQALQQQALQQQALQQQALQQQAQQQPGQQAPVAVGTADDLMLDDMLMDAPPDGMSEMDIEMDAPSMDMSDAGLGPEDEVLKTLFANEESEQAEQGQTQQEQAAQQKQAGMSRTAANRTVGTRPSGGVSRVGGGAAGGRGSDTDKLSSLWASAPDVKDAFNM